MRRTILLFLVVSPFYCFPQNVEIKDVELAGEDIIVHYDLQDSNPTNEYSLELYASKDNFSSPLRQVKGDIGEEIIPGVDRKVTWRVRDEFGGYSGKISFEIRGKVFTPIVKFQEFKVDKKYKRGKSYPLKWRPGNSNPVNIELFKGTQRISGEVNHPNSGSSLLSIPADAVKGDDYRVKVTDTKNPSGIVYTRNFRVVPKLPLLVKVIAPLAIVGGVVFVLGSSGTSTPDPSGDQEIPGVPSLPGN
ncbi:MAG: hypothetical protein RIF39_18500 [Cyclobacteriaceae bacterium]